MSDQGKSNINKQQHYILSNRGVVNRDNGASSMNRSGQYQGSQNLQSNDLETAFEKKLGISNMMALAEASAGDRRSYPRVASTSSKHAFALQNIRKDLEDMPQQQMSNWQHSFDNELSKNDYRSNSYTDLHQSHRSTDLSILMSYGLDENSAKEALCLYPNKSIDYIIDLLKRNNVFNNTHRATPTQRLFGVTQNGPRSQNIPMTNGRSALHNNGQPTMRYQSETLRSHNANDGVGFQVSAQYPERPISGSYMSDGDTISLDSGMSQSSRYYDKPSVTLRQKPDRALANQQRPWSVEILHKNVMDESNKRSYMEAYAHKPPPPYPGSTKNSLNRISSQEGEFQAVKNTPITVIFDQENERVNVVGGIPDGFESTNPSSSSSGQSSPPASQKHPPPYNYLKQYNNPPNGQQKSSHSKPPVVVQGNFNTNKKPTVTYAIPTPNASKSSVDEKFKPISESLKSDRGSPPPYPGSNSSTTSSNRVSLNVDDLESSVGYYSTQSSSQSAASSVKDNDSTSSTSPVPGDDVERSYSPLPVIQSLTLNSNYDKTMIIHQKNQIDFDEVSTDETDEAFSTRLKHYTPQAYKFYMEQHVENLFKQQEQRKIRRQQLEAEMSRVRLPIQAQEQMRKLLNQKESNYIRLRRAKMDKSMFTKIKVVGVGAFGEVSLVRKKETNAYYAMKTLRKSEVLRRNQVAHVKAERDILAEADNEWVVKLYYSFQNQQYLYFVMDYVPGGDLMALLIKFGIFNEPLARFYISELVLAIESVHKLGFIHRDIKPDNILIDKNGHIKLTDFGLCTGFRWTHDSKYYQPEPEGGGHTRQYSMEPEGGWESLMDDTNCNCKNHRMQYDLLKPLQRRKLRRHMRCQAHSLVGTPNYIAPEVLMRIPYGQQCDWWSVGVIMYEMLIGQPPFLAQSPAETQFKVINWRQILNIPRNRLEPEAEDLIRKLCSDPNERIGKDDAEQIKLHPYFDGVDFLTLHAEKAPHVPTIKNATDTSNFDPVPEAMIEDDFEDHAEKNNVKTNKEGPEYAFYEFTFRHFFDDGGLVNPNPNTEFEVSETNENPKQASKRGAASVGNNSMTVPTKVSASSSSTSEEKTPIYV